MTDIKATLDPKMGKVVVSRAPENPLEYSVSFRPNPTLPCGEFSATIEITAVLEDGERVPAVAVPVNGTVIPDVMPIPERLRLGAQKVGQWERREIALQAASGREFRVDNVVAEGGHLTTSPSATGFAPRHVLQVAVPIRHKGDQHMSARIQIRFRDDETLEVPLSVAYYGM